MHQEYSSTVSSPKGIHHGQAFYSPLMMKHGLQHQQSSLSKRSHYSSSSKLTKSSLYRTISKAKLDTGQDVERTSEKEMMAGAAQNIKKLQLQMVGKMVKGFNEMQMQCQQLLTLAEFYSHK